VTAISLSQINLHTPCIMSEQLIYSLDFLRATFKILTQMSRDRMDRTAAGICYSYRIPQVLLKDAIKFKNANLFLNVRVEYFLKQYLSSRIFVKQVALQDSAEIKTACSNGSCRILLTQVYYIRHNDWNCVCYGSRKNSRMNSKNTNNSYCTRAQIHRSSKLSLTIWSKSVFFYLFKRL